jgi:hypothetical protein
MKIEITCIGDNYRTWLDYETGKTYKVPQGCPECGPEQIVCRGCGRTVPELVREFEKE